MATVPKLEDYTVVLFCPLVVEQQAAYLMLDEVHHGTPERSPGQTVLYTLGMIASHNVAIAGYSFGEAGVGVSGSMVAEALRDFPNLEVGLLVGIAAGIPSQSRDIRLGDVVVAVPDGDKPGVIGYDLIKVGDDQVRLKQWQNSTHSLLRSAISGINVRDTGGFDGFRRHVQALDFRKAPAFKRPISSSISTEFADSPLLERDWPVAHYGTVLSGNSVIKSKRRRDELRDQYNAIAIEMEAAGMMTRLGVAVIRGVSDFADSNKNDDWHAYASLAAAAYAKEVIRRLGPLKQPGAVSDSIFASDLDACLRLALPELRYFVGREIELAQMDQCFPDPSTERLVLCLWGLGGVGKSQLASEFVRRQRLKQPTATIFWVSGESTDSFEQSITNLLKVAQHTVDSGLDTTENHYEQRGALVKSFFAELAGPARRPWLLVIDGVSNDNSLQRYIRSCMETLPQGNIILISRSKPIATWYHQRIEVNGLPEASAVSLLEVEIDDPCKGDSEDMLKLAQTLKCHPMSLRLAASTISCSSINVAEYVDRWELHQLDKEQLQTDYAQTRSLEVSFEELEKVNPLATKLLMLFSFLDHGDLWYDLCLNASDADDFPDWLSQLADEGHFNFTPLRHLSFVEAKPNGRRREFNYEIHPVIHEFARRKARDEEELYVRCAVSLVAAQVPRSTDNDFVPMVKRLEPHAEQCMIYLNQDRGGLELDLIELAAFGNLFRHLGRYQEAHRLYEGVLNVLQKEQSPNQDDLEIMADVTNNLGLVYHAQEKYELAIQCFDSRLGITTEDLSALMGSQYNKGRSLMTKGSLDESLECFKSVAAMCTPGVTPGSLGQPPRTEWNLSYFGILNDMGEIYLRQNKVELAESHFEKSFRGLARQMHDQHPAVFAVRLNMGRVCTAKSLFSAAKKIFEYIIQTYTKWWGRRHSETMRAVAELAYAQTRHGQLKGRMGDGGSEELNAAAELWEEVVGFREQVYSADSELLLLSRMRLYEVQNYDSTVSEDQYRVYYASGDG